MSVAPIDPETIRFIGDLARLELRPGDRFVLTTDKRPSDDQIDRIRTAWRAFAGDAPLIVLDGCRLGVIGADDLQMKRTDGPPSSGSPQRASI